MASCTDHILGQVAGSSVQMSHPCVGLNQSAMAATAISDDSGSLYITIGHAIDRIEVMRDGNSMRLGQIRYYTTAEGLAPGESGTAHRDHKGTFWLQGDYGLSQLQPNTERTHPSRAPTRGLRIPAVPFLVSELGESAIAVPRLKSAPSDIQISYTGSNFAPGETLHYQYMLGSAYRGSSEPTTLRSVNYAKLSPGAYRLLVRVADAGSPVADPGFSVPFIIDPPLLRRWWFLAALAAVVIGAGVAVYRMRVDQLLELERVRTRIATDLHDDIGANLSQIAILSEVARKEQAGNNYEALARIAEVSRETVHSMSDIVWAVDPENDHFADLTNRMRRFANDVMSGRNIKLCFQPSAEREIRVPADVRREIFLIFKECINNAARHSGCDAVEVEVKARDGSIHLTLADNGRGFEGCAASSGHGLNNMRRRALALGGVIEVMSCRGGGVLVHLRVPLSNGMLHD
jgi:two-component sensor histidine kinase